MKVSTLVEQNNISICNSQSQQQKNQINEFSNDQKSRRVFFNTKPSPPPLKKKFHIKKSKLRILEEQWQQNSSKIRI